MGLTGKYLNSDNFNSLEIDLTNFQQYLIEAGYITSSIFEATYPDALIFPYNIRQLFWNVEHFIEECETGMIDWVNPYGLRYVPLYSWFSHTKGMLYQPVNRWFNWIEYNMKIVRKEIQKQQNLFDNSNEMIYDIDGNEIFTQEGYFGEE